MDEEEITTPAETQQAPIVNSTFKHHNSKKIFVEGINAPAGSLAQATFTDTHGTQSEPTPKTRLLMHEVKRTKQPGTGKWWFISILLFAWGATGWFFWYRLNTEAKNNQPPIASATLPTPKEEAVIMPSGNTTATTTPTTTSATASSTVPTAINPPTPTTSLTITNTPTGFVNVRSQPSLAGTIILKAHPGEAYFYTKSQSGWYNITLPNNTSGWVSAQYVSVSK